MKTIDGGNIYTSEEMLESDIQSFGKGIVAGLAGALTVMQTLDNGIHNKEITHEEAWNILKTVLSKQIHERSAEKGGN